jgi:hypothetical protein
VALLEAVGLEVRMVLVLAVGKVLLLQVAVAQSVSSGRVTPVRSPQLAQAIFN